MITWTLKQGVSSELSYEINMLLRCLNYILVIKNVISNKYIISSYNFHNILQGPTLIILEDFGVLILPTFFWL